MTLMGVAMTMAEAEGGCYSGCYGHAAIALYWAMEACSGMRGPMYRCRVQQACWARLCSQVHSRAELCTASTYRRKHNSSQSPASLQLDPSAARCPLPAAPAQTIPPTPNSLHRRRLAASAQILHPNHPSPQQSPLPPRPSDTRHTLHLHRRRHRHHRRPLIHPSSVHLRQLSPPSSPGTDPQSTASASPCL